MPPWRLAAIVHTMKQAQDENDDRDSDKRYVHVESVPQYQVKQ